MHMRGKGFHGEEHLSIFIHAYPGSQKTHLFHLRSIFDIMTLNRRKRKEEDEMELERKQMHYKKNRESCSNKKGFGRVIHEATWCSWHKGYRGIITLQQTYKLNRLIPMFSVHFFHTQTFPLVQNLIKPFEYLLSQKQYHSILCLSSFQLNYSFASLTEL